MIDYEDLRKKAEAAKSHSIIPAWDWKDMWAEPEHPINAYIQTLPPDITLRLLEIIAVTKTAIQEANERIYYNNTHRQRYEDRNDEQTIDAINYLLDDVTAEIAKIENED